MEIEKADVICEKVNCWGRDYDAINFFYSVLSNSNKVTLDLNKFSLEGMLMVSVMYEDKELFFLQNSDNLSKKVCSILHGEVKKNINQKTMINEFDKIKFID